MHDARADQAHRLVPQRPALPDTCALRQMEDADIHRRAQMPWLDRPLHVDAPMNRRIFETWIETQLAPTLAKGDVVILDNVGFHKSERASQLVKDRGAWLLFLPAYSPDLNPIEMAFSKLKALLRKRAAQSFDAITRALSDIVGLFSITECQNFFKASGYEAE